MFEATADGVIVVLALVFYYKVLLVLVRDRLVPVAVSLALQHPSSRRYTVIDIENIIQLLVAVVLQFVLLVFLVESTSVKFGDLWPARALRQPQLLVFGAALGLGELLLGSLLGLTAIKISLAVPQLGNPLVHWRVVLKSGWMRLFFTTIKVLPRAAAIPIVTLYIGVEELIIRGVVLKDLLPLGNVLAVVLSTAIFVGYQVFNLPSWRVALFPVLGALVIGPIHGVLYIAVPDVWPLVVAHITYFTVVALTFR